MHSQERQIETQVKFCLEATGVMLSKRKAKLDRSEIKHFVSQDCFTQLKMNAGIYVQGIDTCSMKLIQKSRIPQRTKLIPHRGKSKEPEFFPAQRPVQEAHAYTQLTPPDTCMLDSNKSAEPQPVYSI